ncbi:LADA_0H08658g1_1 [Lachancea dasiensis]|uniref:LADA_0H08658g1_1 n=1 Tax=Lachancea dasiensis TaxID=1072105 RepID=A0A1G4K2U1_9SACH|nr:LADA_0H08658g1_1 [Lachancea dasiensis]
MTSSKAPASTKEYEKLLSRREELIKQESSLKREYTTMLRKLASVITIVQDIGNETEASELSISETAMSKAPVLVAYAKRLEELENQDIHDVEVPDFLQESYTLYKNSSLMYKDL